jgi:NADH dehydrogenase FAD-containing subunit
VLIDRHDYHQFTPLLYQVASALLTAPDISYPFRAPFRDAPNVRFRHAPVTGIDLERRLVREVTPEAVLLSTGDTLETRTAVWSAGINATEFAGVSRLATGRSRRLPPPPRLTGPSAAATSTPCLTRLDQRGRLAPAA